MDFFFPNALLYVFQVYQMAQPRTPQFSESVMIFALHRYYGPHSELRLRLTLNRKVARLLFVFGRAEGWVSALGFSALGLCPHVLLRQLSVRCCP